jgi:RNA polymerase sigma factor (sigma-70 family)
MTPAERRLVIEHTGLADRLAARAVRDTPTVWQGDLHSAALEGLIAAAITYRDDRGATFTTWAYLCIRHAIADERQHLLTGRKHSDRPDAPRTRDRRGDLSIDAPYRQLNDMTGTPVAWSEYLAQADADPADIYAQAAHTTDNATQVRGALATLTPDDRHLLRRYYHQGMTLAEIARQDGLSESGVWQRLKRIRTVLRQTRTYDPNPDNH